MKPIRTVSLIMLISIITFNLWSQGNGEWGGKLRQRFTQIKLNEIGRELNLSPDRLERFRPVYMRYDFEKTNSKIRLAKGLMRVNPDSLTEDEAERLVRDQLVNARRQIEIREKYYDEFRKVLTAKEIVRLYQCENDIQRKIGQEVKRRTQRIRDRRF